MTKCWHEGRWHPEGTPVTRGRYHYTCQGGELQPQGCVGRDRRQYRISETWNVDGFQKTCVLDNDGRLKIKISGCAPDDQRGRAFAPGESWNDSGNKFWFTCKQDNPWSVRSEIGGCVDWQGRRVPKGDESSIKDDIWWVCGPKPNGAVGMCVGGCMHNGRKYKVGDSWPEGEFVYYCKTIGEDRCDGTGRIDTPCVGCQVQGNRLNDGDRYHDDGSVFQCDIRPEYHKHRLVGCAQQNSNIKVERRVGCHWYQNWGDQYYELECIEENGKAKSKTVGCIYMEAGKETVMVPPNSYTTWWTGTEEIALACKPGGGGNGEMVLEKMPADQVPYRATGLRFSVPRG